MPSLPHVDIYTDGSCLGNPGPGGWAALLKYQQHERLISGNEAHTTNNRMELTAVIKALQALTKPVEAQLYTDSTYVKQGISQWIKRWQQNGWQTSRKQAVKNADLWQALSQASTIHTVSWHWVKAHNGHIENERVDQMAYQAAKALTE